MFRTNNFGWKLTHVLCILAHLCLIVGGTVAYVYNVTMNASTVVDWNRLAKLGLDPGACAGLALSGELVSLASFDMALQTLPLSCLILVGRTSRLYALGVLFVLYNQPPMMPAAD
jgi:hypothetical protein